MQLILFVHVMILVLSCLLAPPFTFDARKCCLLMQEASQSLQMFSLANQTCKRLTLCRSYLDKPFASLFVPLDPSVMKMPIY